ncbi:MAG TPA: family 78 glycoside hydrolase catalytic domain [Fontimonas sp.]
MAIVVLLGGCAVNGARSATDDSAPSALPTQLRAEYMREPLGIDVAQPRLDWRRPALGSDGRQSAYRIRVADSVAALEAAPLWDSGKIASAASHQVAYGGPALSARTRYWWQVQTWDGADRVSGWSAPAWLETGLLQPQDWQAQWISGRLDVDHDWKDSTLSVDFTLSGKSFGTLFRARPVGKTYGEAYLWNITQEGGQVRLIQQVRRYAGGNSSKVNVATLKTLTLSTDAAAWIAQPHRLQIETSGDRIVTRIDGSEVDSLSDTAQPNGTIGFFSPQEDAAVVHAVSVKSSSGEFSTDFSDGINPFTGGTLAAKGLQVAAGVPDKDLVLPIAAPAPLLRRAFELASAPVSARLYVAAGGLPSIAINGTPIGEAMQDGYTDYSKRVLVRTFDVTAALRSGANVLSAELGRGWYGVTEPNEWYWHMAPWHAAPALRAQLEVTLADGQRQVIGTDGQWRTSDGPTRHDSVYAGERYDARLRPKGWQRSGFDDSRWSAANVVSGPAGVLSAAAQEPIAITGAIRPVAITEPKPGVYVFDFGRIFSGRLQLNVKGPRGTTVRMIQTEKLKDDGTVAIAGGLVDTQLQTDQYTLSGEGREQWSPQFGYSGLRYVQVEGFPGKPTLDALSGKLMHSDVDTSASFTSSNELLNKIQAAARNTLLNNLFGNQTDTPTYEKNGWTGDAQASALAAILNFDVARVWTKWLADFRDAQSPKGEIPEVIPTTPYYGYEDTPGWGAVWGPVPSWDAATFILPWELYEQQGDTRILADMYETQKKLVDYTGNWFTPEKLSYRNPNNFMLGEYAAVMPPGGLIAALRQQPNGPIDATASAYYFHMLKLLAKSATLLGKPDDAAQYEAIAAKVREAYNARYWDAAGEYYKMPAPTKDFAQTPNILAIAFGLIPDGKQAAVMRWLNDDIVKRGYHLGCGVYAGRYVMTMLADHGYVDTAYKVATRTDAPSWGFWIANGLSTMAEAWELSVRSWNHHYWASISSYFYQSLAGIRATSPGYATARIKPQPPEGLDAAEARVRTPYGVLASSWRRVDGRYRLTVDVPAGIDAEIWLPLAGATAPAAPAGARFDVERDGYAVYRAGAGTYEF